MGNRRDAAADSAVDDHRTCGSLDGLAKFENFAAQFPLALSHSYTQRERERERESESERKKERKKERKCE